MAATVKGGEILGSNIVKIDNLSNKSGFVKASNEVINKYRQERKFYELALWLSLISLAGTDFELTVKSVRTLMGGQRETARRALKTLQTDGLIKASLEKERNDQKFIVTKDGRKVPNTRRIYEIYTALPEVQEQKFTPIDDFTVDEIKASECSAPPQALAETAEMLPQSRELTQRNNKGATRLEQLERRKEQVYRIANEKGLFSKTGKENLLFWLQRFKKEVGKTAANDEIADMAEILSGDSKADLSGYIKRKALSEQPA